MKDSPQTDKVTFTLDGKPVEARTLIQDNRHPGLGHCLADFTQVDGAEISLCPRTMLRRVTDKVKAKGYVVKASFELEFFLFNTPQEPVVKCGYSVPPRGSTRFPGFSWKSLNLLKNPKQ